MKTASGRSRSEMEGLGIMMASALAHRGPDKQALWQDPDVPLLLAHRRLAILDLSEDGTQPMASADDRYMLAYNGEIYNYLHLKNELETHGAQFKGHSDTEVILAAVQHYGFEKTLGKINGMFSIALWDRKERILHFARDRMGKKPLYIGWAGKALVFSSELKAFRTHPEFKPRINDRAIHGYMHHGYVQAPYCIYEGCWQLPPAHKLSVSLASLNSGENLASAMRAYWSQADVVEAAKRNPVTQSEDEITDAFETLIEQCVSERMISDVPLGAFLSGGIDSSSVVAMMQKISSAPIKTYSIGFEEAGFNEAAYAAKIAKHLGTEHFEHICSTQDAKDVIPKLPEIYDEPFADISAIPTYLVSAFARRDVTVALSGDGGDEMLGGYARHVQGPKIWNKMRLMPRVLRSGLASAIQQVPVNTLDSLNRAHPQWGTKVHKAASILSLESQEEIYQRLTQKWKTVPLANGADEVATYLSEPDTDLSFAEKMMLWDTLSYLPHNILTKVDRASMAVGLEARAPLLDTRLFEYVWRLPQDVKIRDGQGKWLLRQVLNRHVPAELFERPKQGFNMPVGDWLRGDLRSWAEDLLDEKAMAEQGVLDGPAVRKTWQAHLDGQGNHADALWVVLMFQAWYKRWM